MNVLAALCFVVLLPFIPASIFGTQEKRDDSV
jgi:hypothetical protein